MRLLLDTNILLHLSKDASFRLFEKFIGIDNQKVFISVVTIAELKSILIQNNWADKRKLTLEWILDKAILIEITENLVDTYAQIDSFSQCRNPHHRSQSFSTPRNMGKNDLWIAATAALLGLKLITTDADFNHLHDVFIEVECLKSEQLKA